MDLAELPWISTAFVLPAAGFTLVFGRLADLFGRRMMFLSGMVRLAVGSLLGGVATGALVGGVLVDLLSWRAASLLASCSRRRPQSQSSD